MFHVGVTISNTKERIPVGHTSSPVVPCDVSRVVNSPAHTEISSHLNCQRLAGLIHHLYWSHLLQWIGQMEDGGMTLCPTWWLLTLCSVSAANTSIKNNYIHRQDDRRLKEILLYYTHTILRTHVFRITPYIDYIWARFIQPNIFLEIMYYILFLFIFFYILHQWYYQDNLVLLFVWSEVQVILENQSHNDENKRQSTGFYWIPKHSFRPILLCHIGLTKVILAFGHLLNSLNSITQTSMICGHVLFFTILL